jgi:hypothetical protein
MRIRAVNWRREESELLTAEQSVTRFVVFSTPAEYLARAGGGVTTDETGKLLGAFTRDARRQEAAPS